MQHRAAPVSLPAPVESRQRCMPLLRGGWAEFRFLVRASRPGFWLTAMWFYLLPLWPDLPLRSPSFWLGLLYVGMPLGLLLYASNDLTDEENDRVNPRKDISLFGVRPTREQMARMPWCIFLAQVPFMVAFVWLLGPAALLWFVVMAGMSMFYNFVAKERPVLDLSIQAGYVMVFVLANWLCGLPPAPWYIYVFGALFAAHSHLFGEIMDIEPDRLTGRRTTAVCIGYRASKALMMAFLLVESALALQIGAKPWLSFFLAGSIIWFALDAIILWRDRPYAPWQMSAFFLGWNVLICLEIALSAAVRAWL